MSLWADDSQLYFSLKAKPGGSIEVENRCLEKEMGWVRTNQLKFSPDKTEALLLNGEGTPGLCS